MNVAIIDADLIRRKRHRFPNLAAMKISAYHKARGDTVTLKTDYDSLQQYDKVTISKVFTDTEVPADVLTLPNVECGGTGFFFDKAPPLPDEIEHIMPDYHLYDAWIASQPPPKPKTEYKEYTDYSIGFMTRGCFRGCEFCVNRNYRGVVPHSPLDEFYDPTRKKICLLDDNFFGCHQWRPLLEDLMATGKRFKFKQGMDERILTPEKCELLFAAKYDESYTFAFDNYADRDIVVDKIKLIRQYTDTQKIVFYVLVGFDRRNKWDMDFWRRDLIEMFERIFILSSYNVSPYIMRFARYVESPFYGLYVTVARWCNTFSLIKKLTLREFVEATDRPSPKRYLQEAEDLFPEIRQYYNRKAYIT